MKDLVAAGWIALRGTAKAAERDPKIIESRFPGKMAEKAKGFGALADDLERRMESREASGAESVFPVKGSILRALWELTETEKCGLDVVLRSLPLLQETVEIAEICQENPYEWACGGCYLLTTEAGEGPELAESLSLSGIPAVPVGALTDGNEKILRVGADIRYLNRPDPETGS